MIKASHMIRRNCWRWTSRRTRRRGGAGLSGGASRQDRDAARKWPPEGGHFHDSKPEAQSLRRNTSLSSDEADAS